LRSVEKCYQGSSVQVFRLDEDGVVARLKERARALIDADPAVLEVRLFGSLARGGGRPGSDADLFVVLRDGAPPFLERIPRLARHFEGAGVGCDLIPYTESEYAALAARRDAFSRAVIDDGTVVARR
jgi:predicted nucleotidyltransferase